RLANARGGEGFIAVSAEARKKFWLDRARTAAISRHTNAFKINEDVVIPLPRMAEYTDAIERLNIQLSTGNKLRLTDELERLLQERIAHANAETSDDDTPGDEAVKQRIAEALEIVHTARERWQYVLASLDRPLEDVKSRLLDLGYDTLKPELARRLADTPAARLIDLVQDRALRISWKTEIRSRLSELLIGPLSGVLAECDATHQRVLKSRVFIALHMHAGDGNVHTNIPVNSDDYGMLQEANAAVTRIMQIARSLNGVISGEHGIGITKYEFLTDAETSEFRAYKQRIDAQGRFNAGKLLPG